MGRFGHMSKLVEDTEVKPFNWEVEKASPALHGMKRRQCSRLKQVCLRVLLFKWTDLVWKLLLSQNILMANS
ncbi:hypothetical protein AMECASPLE_018875 [Ameca splendens]|uniref:Uncharacterized protein n=1 Tax=Ameca splendens TaxID=208324 RepID=A0ABV0ZZI3_9TELE